MACLGEGNAKDREASMRYPTPSLQVDHLPPGMATLDRIQVGSHSTRERAFHLRTHSYLSKNGAGWLRVGRLSSQLIAL